MPSDDTLINLGVFAGLLSILGLAVRMVFKGLMIPAKWKDEVVQQITSERDAERKAKEDALAANKELMLQNTLLLQKDDIPSAVLAAIHELIEEHKGEKR